MIYPASRFAELTERLRQEGLTPKRLRPVYPAPDRKATRILVEAILGGGEELAIEGPLFLKDRAGEYTEEVQQIYYGFSA